MEFGEMKRNTSNWNNFCMLLRRAGFTASAGLSCNYDVVRNCSDLRNNRISVIEDGAFEGMYQLEEL